MSTLAPRPRKSIAYSPTKQITVSPSRSAIVLSGHVSTEDVAKRAGMTGQAYSKNVVNVLTFGPVGAQEVLLRGEVRGSRPHRPDPAGHQHVSTGGGNTIGTTQTGQFGGFGPQHRHDHDHQRQTAPAITTTTQLPTLNFRLSESFSCPHRHQLRRGDRGSAVKRICCRFWPSPT